MMKNINDFASLTNDEAASINGGGADVTIDNSLDPNKKKKKPWWQFWG